MVFDATLYWFMFPVSIWVAACAVSAGIGGAALFAPIFLIIFPLLGQKYVISTARTSIVLAIIIETFGFSSGNITFIRHYYCVPQHLIMSLSACRVDRLSAQGFNSLSNVFACVGSFYTNSTTHHPDTYLRCSHYHLKACLQHLYVDVVISLSTSLYSQMLHLEPVLCPWLREM